MVGLKRCFQEPELSAPNPSGRALQMPQPWSLLGCLSEPRRRPPGGSDWAGLGWAPPPGPFLRGSGGEQPARSAQAGEGWPRKERSRTEGQFHSCPLSLKNCFGINVVQPSESGGPVYSLPQLLGPGGVRRRAGREPWEDGCAGVGLRGPPTWAPACPGRSGGSRVAGSGLT